MYKILRKEYNAFSLMLALTEPLAEHVEQVKGYAEDTKKKFPNYNVRSYVVYICANKGWKCWEV